MPFGLALMILIASANFTLAGTEPSDTQVKQLIIGNSLTGYPGNCPCPYNTDRRGRMCGRRSAYSRPGGYAPVCYESDVSPAMLKAYKAQHGG